MVQEKTNRIIIKQVAHLSQRDRATP